MTRLIITVLITIVSQSLLAQYYPLPHVDKKLPFDTAAVFPGGSSAMLKFFCDSTIYPQPEFDQRKAGSVLLKFRIDSTGKVSNVHVINGVAGAPNFVPEAKRVVMLMPRWTPAIKSGRYVSSEYNVSFPFDLKKANLN
jgi:TonB family protein